MMLCLGLRCGAERVYRRALKFFTVEEITEGFAAARGLALPSQLRRLLRAQGRDLHAEFVRLLPTPPPPVRIQRWSLRRVGLWAAIVLLVALASAYSMSRFNNNDLGTKTLLHIDNLGCAPPQGPGKVGIRPCLSDGLTSWPGATRPRWPRPGARFQRQAYSDIWCRPRLCRGPGAHLEPLWLQAQAVPSASLLPCVRSLPVGWRVASVTVNSGRSVVTLDNDRAGAGAMVVRLTAGCDPAGATQIVSDQREVRRYQRTESLTPAFSSIRFDMFPGGCLITRVRAPATRAPEVATEVPLILGFTTRQALQQLAQRSDGRLRLDPGGP